jgi:hypothetical protein
MRGAGLVLLLVFTHGCASVFGPLPEQVCARVEEKDIKDGKNPHLQIGMSVRQAAAYLEELGFRPEQRECTGSRLPKDEGSALHYVKIFPHPGPLIVFHHEVHVLLFHDGQQLRDVRSELIYTAVD